MKLNNKGFAVSGILYTILLLFLVLIVSLMSMFSNRKLILDQLKNDITESKFKKYENGEVIYFNPNTGTKCDLENYNLNVNEDGVIIASNTGTISGCMKWYVYNDNEDSSTLNLILDHNTTSSLAYKSIDNDNLLKEQLSVDTGEWHENILNISLITANSIAKITNNTTWSPITSTTNFYFENNIEETPTSYTEKYKWLYDRTSINCIETGCANNNDVDIKGYWTNNSLSDGTKSWAVNYDGSIVSIDNTNSTEYGIRPVIKIYKSYIN